MPGFQSLKEVFIISLWKLHVESGSYHGLIQNVRTGKSEAIDDLEGLIAYFSRYFSSDKGLEVSADQNGKGLR